MRLPSAIRTFEPAFFHQSPGRLDGAPMLGRGLPTNYPFGALHGALPGRIGLPLPPGAAQCDRGCWVRLWIVVSVRVGLIGEQDRRAIAESFGLVHGGVGLGNQLVAR